MIRRFSVYGGYDDTLRWLAVACAFTLSLPTAWLSFASGIFAVMYILTGNFSTRFGVIKRNPPALTCVILSLWMAVALTWSPASWSEGFDNWWKYRELLLFPAIGSLIWIDEQTANQWQGRLLVAFLAGFFIAFVVSWFRWVGLLPDLGFKGLYAGFHGRTGYSLMLAFVAYLCLHQLANANQQGLVLSLILLICLINLYVVNDGRTGQLGFLLLLLFWAKRCLPRKWFIAMGLLLPIVCVTLVWVIPSNQSRFEASVEQWYAFKRGESQAGDSLRLEYWQRAVQSMSPRTLIQGNGTGSYQFEHGANSKGLQPNKTLPSANPHNEYLLVLSQHGFIGLALLLLIGYQQWKTASHRVTDRSSPQQALVLLVGFGSLFNCLLLDNLEGHFYILMSIALGSASCSGRAIKVQR